MNFLSIFSLVLVSIETICQIIIFKQHFFEKFINFFDLKIILICWIEIIVTNIFSYSIFLLSFRLIKIIIKFINKLFIKKIIFIIVNTLFKIEETKFNYLNEAFINAD